MEELELLSNVLEIQMADRSSTRRLQRWIWLGGGCIWRLWAKTNLPKLSESVIIQNY